MAVIVVERAVDMPWMTMPMPVALTAFSSTSDAPISAIERDTMVPNTPVRIRILLMKRGSPLRVLSLATRVAASAF